MKTNEEIAAKAFERRDEHKKAIRKRKRIAGVTALSLAAATAVTVGVLAASRTIGSSPEKENERLAMESLVRDDTKDIIGTLRSQQTDTIAESEESVANVSEHRLDSGEAVGSTTIVDKPGGDTIESGSSDVIVVSRVEESVADTSEHRLDSGEAVGSTTIVDEPGGNTIESGSGDVIVVNRIEEIGATSADWAGEVCTHEDIAAAFGEWVFPEVPAEFAEGYWSKEPDDLGAEHRWFFVRYDTEWQHRSLLVEMREGRRSFHECCICPDDENKLERSLIAGTEVWIGQLNNEGSRYECVFEHNGIWFKIESHSVRLDDLVAAVRSIIAR